MTTVPYQVYIIRCSDGSLYTGITNNIERRLEQHNGTRRGGARYTRAKRPVELVYTEEYQTRGEATSREYEIKHTLTREEKQSLIASKK